MSKLSARRVETLKDPGLCGDGDILYLSVKPSGSKSWILRTVVHGKRRDLCVGASDLVSLAEARDNSREWRKVSDAALTVAKLRQYHPIRNDLSALRHDGKARLDSFLVRLTGADTTPYTRVVGRKFCNGFREWCDAAGLPHCSVHGLRKDAAARLAELGRTEFEIMAITGHQTSKEVTRYTKAASQKTRAASAVVKMTAERN
ncbi:integrase arm-type DNA-binding domain-containing protein [Cypionkella sp. TWP1-2-1b2]|uniref:Arm DNA-binding domain-containing protein n=1 Tax=Cypionkella sp. TWP1-2-1b2 TaxID=2804675 RepID=UPI003CEF8661